MGAVDNLDRIEATEFVKAVYSHVGSPPPDDTDVVKAIDQALSEFRGRLDTGSYYPKRKYQAHPVCTASGCGNIMSLTRNGAALQYVCKTPRCGKRLEAKIERD